MKTLELFQTAPHLSYEESTNLIAQALQEDPITTIAVIFFLSDQQGQHQLITQLNSIVVDHLSSYDEFFDSYLRLIPHIPDVSSWSTLYQLYGTHQYVDMHVLSEAQIAIVDMQLVAAISDFPPFGDISVPFAAFIGEDVKSLRDFLFENEQPLPLPTFDATDYSAATADTMQTCISSYLPHVSAAF
jgi:hypothetical protein